MTYTSTSNHMFVAYLSTLMIDAGKEVRTRCRERVAVDQERGAVFGIEARVHEWAER